MISFLTAAYAVIDAAVTRVYRMGSVPLEPAYPYLVVAVSHEVPETYDLSGTSSVGVVRLTTQSFAATLEAALDTDDRARAVVLDRRLTVAGFDCGLIRQQVGAAVVRDTDAGSSVLGVTSTYLFTATPTS